MLSMHEANCLLCEANGHTTCWIFSYFVFEYFVECLTHMHYPLLSLMMYLCI